MIGILQGSGTKSQLAGSWDWQVPALPNTASAGMEQQLYKCLGPGVLVELAVSHRGWPACQDPTPAAHLLGCLADLHSQV